MTKLVNPSRRKLLLGASAAAAVGAGAFAIPLLGGAQPAPRNRLQIPPLLDARQGGQSIALTAQVGRTEFYPGVPSTTLGYNGSYLGPTLRVHRGDEVQMQVTNTLAQDTTVHWHGLIVPGHLDGGPHQTIAPGATWRPVLPVRQPAATLFYHSHVHGATAPQVYQGLAGVLLVSDDAEKSLGLPSRYGIDDLPLVLQDRQFSAGRLVMPAGMMSTMQGARGRTLLVNGTVDAQAAVPAGLVRLRLVNGSNARIYDLFFEDRRSFHWIASEGGMLDAPVALRSLTLAPGERAEVLVDFSDAQPAMLLTGPDHNLPMMGGMGGGMGGRSRADARGEAVLSFAPSGLAGAPAAIPAQLIARAAPSAAQASRRRRFTLDMGMGAMMGGGMGRGGMGAMGGMGGGGMGGMGGFAINGRPFDMHRIDERVRLGETEIWEVSSDMMAHPFHIHGVHFEVLSRGGRAPLPRDRGLRDTVLVQEPVELLVRFTQPSGAAPFMYHCHILEHEDAGMMGQFHAV